MTAIDPGPAVVERVCALFRDALNVEIVSTEADLIDGGFLDSLALVELLFELESEFGVDLALEELDIENFRTVRRIAQFVSSQQRRDAA